MQLHIHTFTREKNGQTGHGKLWNVPSTTGRLLQAFPGAVPRLKFGGSRNVAFENSRAGKRADEWRLPRGRNSVCTTENGYAKKYSFCCSVSVPRDQCSDGVDRTTKHWKLSKPSEAKRTIKFEREEELALR